MWLFQFPGFSQGKEIEIGLNPDDTIHAWDYGSAASVQCGTVAADTWFTLSFIADFAAGVYDVLIDDSTTPCTAIPMQYGNQTPIGGFGLFDPNNDGYGGDIYFDNLHGYTP